MKAKTIFKYLGVAMVLTTFASCSDDDPVLVQEMDVANVHQADNTYNSLTFAWDKIEGVNQYGYVLTDAAGETVSTGVTQFTSVTFDDLATDAKYRFELSVYNETGSTSYVTSIEGSTLPIQQLGEPAPKASQVGNKVKLAWEAVAHADAYEYTYTVGENVQKCVTDKTECLVAGLAPGTHNIEVRALSYYGGYTDSNVVKVTAVRSRVEIAAVTGKYTSGLIRRNNSWECTMHIFDDQSYVIDNFYNNEGYNLDFYVDEEEGTKFIGVYNFASFPDAAYYIIETGRESVPELDIISGLTDGVYGSTFEGDVNGGTVTFNTRYKTATGTDKFEW